MGLGREESSFDDARDLHSRRCDCLSHHRAACTDARGLAGRKIPVLPDPFGGCLTLAVVDLPLKLKNNRQALWSCSQACPLSYSYIRFVSLERGVRGSPLGSIEKSSNSLVVACPWVASFKRNKNIRNENQTISRQVEAGSGEDLSAFPAASRPNARAEHGPI